MENVRKLWARFFLILKRETEREKERKEWGGDSKKVRKNKRPVTVKGKMTHNNRKNYEKHKY